MPGCTLTAAIEPPAAFTRFELTGAWPGVTWTRGSLLVHLSTQEDPVSRKFVIGLITGIVALSGAPAAQADEAVWSVNSEVRASEDVAGTFTNSTVHPVERFEVTPVLGAAPVTQSVIDASYDPASGAFRWTVPSDLDGRYRLVAHVGDQKIGTTITVTPIGSGSATGGSGSETPDPGPKPVAEPTPTGVEPGPVVSRGARQPCRITRLVWKVGHYEAKDVHVRGKTAKAHLRHRVVFRFWLSSKSDACRAKILFDGKSRGRSLVRDRDGGYTSFVPVGMSPKTIKVKTAENAKQLRLIRR